MVFACEKFKPYILRFHVVIHTDHAAIKYLMEKNDAKPILIKWVLLFKSSILRSRIKRLVTM